MKRRPPRSDTELRIEQLRGHLRYWDNQVIEARHHLQAAEIGRELIWTALQTALKEG